MTTDLNVTRCALEPDAASPAIAREAVKGALQASHAEPLRDDAVLLVSEVVTNAVIHAHTPLRLFVQDRPHVVRVEVEDGSTDLPTQKHPAPRSRDAMLESGRGLELLEKVADAWGVESRKTGKVVWFELVDADAADEPSLAYVAG